ncbi:hypothetical protein KDN24_07105 [Bacillus sp. Bva_UNVM-123]
MENKLLKEITCDNGIPFNSINPLKPVVIEGIKLNEKLINTNLVIEKEE